MGKANPCRGAGLPHFRPMKYTHPVCPNRYAAIQRNFKIKPIPPSGELGWHSSLTYRISGRSRDMYRSRFLTRYSIPLPTPTRVWKLHNSNGPDGLFALKQRAQQPRQTRKNSPLLNKTAMQLQCTVQPPPPINNQVQEPRNSNNYSNKVIKKRKAITKKKRR